LSYAPIRIAILTRPEVNVNAGALFAEQRDFKKIPLPKFVWVMRIINFKNTPPLIDLVFLFFALSSYL